MTPTPDPVPETLARLRTLLSAWETVDEDWTPAHLQALGSCEQIVREVIAEVCRLEAELQVRIDARDRAFKEFGHTAQRKDRKCQCPYCTRDADALAEMAADYELRLHEALSKVEGLEAARDEARQELTRVKAEALALTDGTMRAAETALAASRAREAAYRSTLQSIADNSCCAPCREAGLVALAALVGISR